MKEQMIAITTCPPRHELRELTWREIAGMVRAKGGQAPRFNMKLAAHNLDKSVQMPSSPHIPPPGTTTPPPEAPIPLQYQSSSGPATSPQAPSPIDLRTQLPPPLIRSATPLQQPTSPPTQQSPPLPSPPPSYTKSPHHFLRHATSLQLLRSHQTQILNSLASQIISLLPVLSPLRPRTPASCFPIVAPPPPIAPRYISYQPLPNRRDTHPPAQPNPPPPVSPISCTPHPLTIRHYLATTPQLRHTASLYQAHLLESLLLETELDLLHLAARRMQTALPIPAPSTPTPKSKAKNTTRPASGGEPDSDMGLFPPDLTIQDWKTKQTWKDAKGRWADIRREEELVEPLVGVVGGVWGRGKEGSSEKGRSVCRGKGRRDGRRASRNLERLERRGLDITGCNKML